ncbi:8-oxo-dGTP diphosphatase MutT [soil metagenome]
MLKVTCAIIENEEKVLIAQRSETMSQPLKWEFPGGKVEKNESEENCLKREILEELNIHIEIKTRLNPSEFQYTEFSICLIPFVCTFQEGEIRLKEHKMIQWIFTDYLKNYDFAAADWPVVWQYLELKNNSK